MKCDVCGRKMNKLRRNPKVKWCQNAYSNRSHTWLNEQRRKAIFGQRETRESANV